MDTTLGTIELAGDKPPVLRNGTGEPGTASAERVPVENRILRAHLPARLRLSDPERCMLAEIGKRLGRKALEKVACAAKPNTLLAWRQETSLLIALHANRPSSQVSDSQRVRVF
jgi:hypothetical protein